MSSLNEEMYKYMRQGHWAPDPRDRFRDKKVVFLIGTRSEFDYATKYTCSGKYEGVEFVHINDDRRIRGYRPRDCDHILLNTAERVYNLPVIQAMLKQLYTGSELPYTDTAVHELTVMYSYSRILEHAIAANLAGTWPP